MKRLWKKPAVKITAAAVIVVALALLGLWISSLRPPPLMTFDFLAGRAATARITEIPGSSHNRQIKDIYSFEADFNDVCKAADAELLPLGFEAYGSVEADFKPLGGAIHTVRGYLPPTYTVSAEATFVRITEGTRFVESSDPQSQSIVTVDGHTHKYPYKYESKDGWVTVELSQSRLRLWPPQHLLYRLKMRLQAASRKKS